jgi:hypothetical protein
VLDPAGQAVVRRTGIPQPGSGVLRLLRMTEHGNWVLAVSFTPILSTVTHYMRLWLLCHCFSRPLPVAQEPGNDCALDSLIREECDRYLVNTSRVLATARSQGQE